MEGGLPGALVFGLISMGMKIIMLMVSIELLEASQAKKIQLKRSSRNGGAEAEKDTVGNCVVTSRLGLSLGTDSFSQLSNIKEIRFPLSVYPYFTDGYVTLTRVPLSLSPVVLNIEA